MNIPFDLQRSDSAEPASALLLPSSAPADLLRLCARLGFDPLPEIFAIVDGFLLKLAKPMPEHVGGVLRLRAVAENLWLPVDARLVPELLPDEAQGLTRQRGLVFLPGQRV